MDVIEAIKKRRSIRKYNQSKKITDEQIEKLLDVAGLAPSAGNLQSWHFVVIKDSEIKSQIAQAANNQTFIANADVVFVSCADCKRSSSHYGERGKNLYSIQDATLASLNMWLCATSMGLGVCWVGAFDEKRVSEILSLSENLRPVAILPLGYPAESPQAHPRRAIEKISTEL